MPYYLKAKYGVILLSNNTGVTLNWSYVSKKADWIIIVAINNEEPRKQLNVVSTLEDHHLNGRKMRNTISSTAQAELNWIESFFLKIAPS